jgi:hypothetical protein
MFCALVLCRSLHAHILLWLDAEGLARVRRSIERCVAADLKPERLENATAPFHAKDPTVWQVPEDPQQERLRYIACSRLIHSCGPVGVVGSCREKGTCKEGYPHPLHQDREPQISDGGRWQYFCPRPIDQWVTAHVPATALTWRGSSNMQLVGLLTLAFYVLKYVTKVRCGAESSVLFC